MADNSTNTTYIPTSFGENSFLLKHNGSSIFYKTFDAGDPSIVSINSDSIQLENHFFVTGEKLTYIPESLGSRLQISPLSPGNLLATTFLPDEVYPIVIDGNNIKLALSKELALQDQAVNFTGVGIGANHAFLCDKQNTKCLISLDNIIQSPVSIASTVGIVTVVNSRTLELDSLTGITFGTILKIGEEYTKVINIQYDEVNVGYGTVISNGVPCP